MNCEWAPGSHTRSRKTAFVSSINMSGYDVEKKKIRLQLEKISTSYPGILFLRVMTRDSIRLCMCKGNGWGFNRGVHV